MGVLPDWMIKEGVKITPFAPCEDRPGTISYGATSYGYDARVGYKFQVFKTYPCTVIDPKNFDKAMLEYVDLTPTVTHNWECLGPRGWKCSRCHKPYPHAGAPAPGEVSSDLDPCVNTNPDHVLIPPHSFALAETIEHFEIPRDVLAIVVGKSTYARCGIVVNVTPLEPEWRGKVTVEVSNTTPLPAKVYTGQGIMQIIFLRTDGVTDALLKGMLRMVNDPPIVDPMMHSTINELFHYDLGRSTCRVSYADKKGRYQDQKGITVPFVKG